MKEAGKYDLAIIPPKFDTLFPNIVWISMRYDFEPSILYATFLPEDSLEGGHAQFPQDIFLLRSPLFDLKSGRVADFHLLNLDPAQPGENIVQAGNSMELFSARHPRSISASSLYRWMIPFGREESPPSPREASHQSFPPRSGSSRSARASRDPLRSRFSRKTSGNDPAGNPGTGRWWSIVGWVFRPRDELDNRCKHSRWTRRSGADVFCSVRTNCACNLGGASQNKSQHRPFVGEELLLLSRAIEPAPQFLDHFGGNGAAP